MFLNASGITLNELIDANVAKITKRYPTNCDGAEGLARADKKGLEDDVK